MASMMMVPMDCSDHNPVILTVSFVYLHFAIIVLCLVSVIVPFLVLVCCKFSDVVSTHNTVSSYCASPKHYGNRFLLAFTCLIGGSMGCILVEEFNSRTDNDWRFWPELIACLLLPLVGIFYTEGMDPNTKK